MPPTQGGAYAEEATDHLLRWDVELAGPEGQPDERSQDGPQRREFLARFPEDAQPRKTRIDFIGVWDTVGTMGVPTGPLRMLGQRRYSFHNTNLGDNVARAFQALALDERRRFFPPAIWKREAGLEERLKGYGIGEQILEQTWFVGAHSNVGSGYPDTGLSDQAFGWMARRAMRYGLALDKKYVEQTQEKLPMSDLPISYFPIAERQHCSEALQKLFADLESTLGFVPNVIRAFAWRESRFWKWWAHRHDLMTPSAGLSKAEREMVAVVVSAANDCLYCMTSHGYALRVLLGDPVTAERILLDYHRAGLDTRTLAMLDFAVKITRHPAACGLEDVEHLRKQGFGDEDIWDIAEIAAMYNYTNRLVSATGMLPNPEYHGLAR